MYNAQEVKKLLTVDGNNPVVNIFHYYYKDSAAEDDHGNIIFNELVDYFQKMKKINIQDMITHIYEMKDDAIRSSHKKTINLISKSSWFNEYRQIKPAPKYVYRSLVADFPVGLFIKRYHENKGQIKISSDETPFVPYATSVSGVKIYLESMYEKSSHNFIVRKKFKNEGLLLDFQKLYNDTVNGGDSSDRDEDEVWMKKNDYYGYADINEMFYFDIKKNKVHYIE